MAGRHDREDEFAPRPASTAGSAVQPPSSMGQEGGKETVRDGACEPSRDQTPDRRQQNALGRSPPRGEPSSPIFSEFHVTGDE